MTMSLKNISPAQVVDTMGEGVFVVDASHRITETRIDQPIYRKNLKPVVYVFGDTAGLPRAKRSWLSAARSGMSLLWLGTA